MPISLTKMVGKPKPVMPSTDIHVGRQRILIGDVRERLRGLPDKDGRAILVHNNQAEKGSN